MAFSTSDGRWDEPSGGTRWSAPAKTWPREGHGQATHREDRQRGFIVAFSFTADAEAECTAFYKRTGRIIKLISVGDILEGEFVGKM